MNYVSAFLFSRYGCKQLKRYSLGSIIQYLGINDTRSIYILNVNAISQKYIGDKARQSERLRTKSKLCSKSARRMLAHVLEKRVSCKFSLLAINKTNAPSVRVKGCDITDRLDAWFYKPEFAIGANILNKLKQSGIENIRIGDIATVEYGFMSLENYWSKEKGHPFLRVTNIEDHLIISDKDIKYVNPIESKAEKYRLCEGDIVMVQLGNSTGRIAYISRKHSDWVYPSFSLRIRVCNDIFDSASEYSTSLVSAVKFLVEALIEGKITEPQLITAQQALEFGDNTLDREILSRLKADGLYGEGEPLFPDLDQLYDLLEKAQQASAA